MNKKITITALIMLVLIMLLSGGVQAYQSIPTGTAVRYNGIYWPAYVRKIEASTGGMGLNETINTSTLLATTESNNIDVHQQKNTEYGAAVLLSASAYGKQGNGTTGSNYVHTNTYGLATSTGNVYGIYELGQGYYEWIAGGNSKWCSTNVDNRYENIYTTTAASIGDASLEAKAWHGGGYDSSWVGTYSTQYNIGLLRGNGSAFGYKSHYSGTAVNMTRYSGASRAVIVSGEGF